MNKNLKIIIAVNVLTLLAIAGGLFYWYEWRPAKIKETCSYGGSLFSGYRKLSGEEARKEKETRFQSCLRRHGL